MTLPLPAFEADRLAALHSLRILDTLPQEVFSHVTALAASICGAPMALITLVDEHRQWAKASLGIELTEIPREQSFCTHTVLDNDRVLVVPDATRDERFADLALVRSGEVKFYAGAPIVTPEGHALGAVCVLDSRQRQLEPHQQHMLGHLASLAWSLLQNEALRREEAERMVERVRQSERIIRHVLDQGREMAAFLDRDHRYRLVNPAFELYWVDRQDEIIGMSLPDLVGENLYRQHLRPAIHRAMAGEEVQVDIEHVYPGLGARHMQVRYGPAYDDDERVEGVVERHRDVTELRLQAQELARTIEALQGKRRMQLKFLQAISHDLREPVNAINHAAPALSEALQAALPQGLDDIQTRCLGFLLRGGRRLASLLDDLRLVGEQDLRELRPGPCPLADCLRRALEQVEGEMAGRPVEVSVDPGLTVEVEAPLFELALRGVLLNIHRASGQAHAALVVRARPLEGWVQIDIGTQADPEALSLARVALLADRPEQPAFEELGLSTARHIVRLHSGVVADAREPGQAPRVLIQMPAHLPVLPAPQGG
jgi:PAS domain S-box-containing protein